MRLRVTSGLGLGFTLVGGGINILLTVVKHPPGFLYVVGWVGVGVGMMVLAVALVERISHRDDTSAVAVSIDGPRKRMGLVVADDSEDVTVEDSEAYGVPLIDAVRTDGIQVRRSRVRGGRYDHP